MPALIPADLRAALPALLAYEAEQVRPASDDALTNAVTAALVLHGGGMTLAERTEFIAVVSGELARFPAALALEAMAHARRTCRYRGDMVPTVIEYLGDLPARQQRRFERIVTLARAAGCLPSA